MFPRISTNAQYLCFVHSSIPPAVLLAVAKQCARLSANSLIPGGGGVVAVVCPASTRGCGVGTDPLVSSSVFFLSYKFYFILMFRLTAIP